MDTVLLALCFVAMGILVLAWAMLPHTASAPIEQVRESTTVEGSFKVQAA